MWDDMKNQIYIESKREKTISEIRSVRKEFKNRPIPVVYVGFSNPQAVIATKFYQLSILKKIENNSERILKKWFTLSRKKLCKDCRKGLKHGDLRCHEDYRIFIFADMLRKSIQ